MKFMQILLNRGSLAAVTIRPAAFRVTPGQWVQFDARARDEAGSLLPDVTFRWSLLDLNAGDLDPAGLFKAGRRVGEYQKIVAVAAVQRIKDMAQTVSLFHLLCPIIFAGARKSTNENSHFS